MPAGDISAQLAEQVRDAAAADRPLRICGFDSKAFLGHVGDHETLELREHRGILQYEPTELVITARAGTPLAEIEETLAANGQMLAFEPPRFGGEGSLGGAVASGLGGPRRPWSGAPRDVMLGMTLLDGRGRIVRFGGEVMKNVAGYDLPRLMAGAYGTLGIMLDLSLKVLPAPATERSIVLNLPRDKAVRAMRDLARQPAPLSGACHKDDRLYLRLSGNASSVAAWEKQIGGNGGDGQAFWHQLRNHRLDFFESDRPLWRLSLAPSTERLDCENEVLTDWGGAQRWVHTRSDPATVRSQAEKVGGHATLFRHGDDKTAAFHPLDAVRERLHRGLKQVFDPSRILNRGRQYATI